MDNGNGQTKIMDIPIHKDEEFEGNDVDNHPVFISKNQPKHVK
jgi:hypothetical protein